MKSVSLVLAAVAAVSQAELSKVQFANTPGGKIFERMENVDVSTEELKHRRLASSNTLTAADKQELLDTHNNQRSETALGGNGEPKAANMNELAWDDALAAVASAYSGKCVWEHNSGRTTDYSSYDSMSTFEYDDTSISVGENLYISYGRAEGIDNLVSGLDGWYEEYAYYTYSTKGCQSGEMCGHYTQAVWAETRYVGCGYTVCSSVDMGSSTWYDATLLVCNYATHGNNGDYPYIEATKSSEIATQCDADRTADYSSGLCSGCMSEWWDFCGDYYSNCASLATYCPSSCTTTSTDNLCVKCRTSCGTCTTDMLTCSTSNTPQPTTPDPTPSPTPKPTTPAPTTPQPTEYNPEPTPKPTLKPTTPAPTTPEPTAVTTTTPKPTYRPTNADTPSPTSSDDDHDGSCDTCYVDTTIAGTYSTSLSGPIYGIWYKCRDYVYAANDGCGYYLSGSYWYSCYAKTFGLKCVATIYDHDKAHTLQESWDSSTFTTDCESAISGYDSSVTGIEVSTVYDVNGAAAANIDVDVQDGFVEMAWWGIMLLCLAVLLIGTCIGFFWSKRRYTKPAPGDSNYTQMSAY